MWYSGFTLAAASNKIGVAVAGATGVVGTTVAGWTNIFAAINAVLTGNSPGWGMTVFVAGLLFTMLVWTINGLFTANHEPIL